MSHSHSETRTPQSDDSHVAARLSTVDRFLPLWIGLAMVAGLLLGRLIPGLANGLNAVSIHGTSLPIAIGLLLMMYPVLAKVRYREIGQITGLNESQVKVYLHRARLQLKSYLVSLENLI